MPKRPDKSLLRSLGVCAEMHRFIEDLSNETDRGMALVAAEFLDDVLAAILSEMCVEDRAAIRPLFEWPGVLSSFVAKVNVSYAFGLINRAQRDSLNAVRQIRNEFGHSHRPVSFTPEIVAKLGQNRSATSLPPRVYFAVVMTALAQTIIDDSVRLREQIEAMKTDPGLAEGVLRKITDQPNPDLSNR